MGRIARSSASPRSVSTTRPPRTNSAERALAAAPDAPTLVKEFADSFVGTKLEETLTAWGVDELYVCGMMTQNCVIHTAISKSAEKYKVTILTDACTTVNELLHQIALHAVSTRVELAPVDRLL
jgi:nicotinamidase-related amidase